MRTLLSCILSLCCTFAVQAEDFTEDFSSLANSKYGANGEQEVALPSGTWTMNKMEAKTSNNVKQLAFTTGGAYVTTPANGDAGKIAIEYGAGGSKQLTISYSVDGGSWTELDKIVIKGSGTGSYSKKTGLDGQPNVRFRITGSASGVYLTKVTVKSVTVVPEIDDPTYITEGAWVPTRPFPEPQQVIYIAPDGNDTTGDGSMEKPLFNLQVAINRAQPGTHIICRGGTYNQVVQSDKKFTVRIKTSGTAEQPIVIRCYDGERPVFDFQNGLTVERVGERGITITGNYWWLFGLHITHAADNGIKLEGSHNRIERCEFSYNLDTGLQLGFGHHFSDTFPGISQNDGSYCAYNDIIDCDSHHNCDYDANYGSDADGFACKMHNGKGNRFIRCRAWHNSDDAWDCFETDFSVVLAECWAWESGKAEDHLWVKDFINKSGGASFSGNGNGIKLGGNGTGGSSKGIHYAFNCISFGNNISSSVKGFDCNNHKEGHVLVGCLGFNNSYDYMFESGGSDANTCFYNNICLGRQEICVGSDDYNALAQPMSKNGWTNHLVTGVNADDFISLDEDDALRPRDIYGGMPRRFGRLAGDSKMVDAGNSSFEETMPVWQQLVEDFPFLQRTVTGTARDLGPYERPAAETSILPVSDCHSTTSTFRKHIENGHLVIEKDGIRYNILGQRL